MHVKVEFLNIAFAFSLFGLLSYKIRSLVKTHFIPYLVQLRLGMKKRYTAIIERKKSVAAALVKTEEQIKNQQIEFFFLEKKIHAWHTHLHRMNSHTMKQHELLREALLQKRAKQHQYLTETKEAFDAVEGAFNDVYEHCKATYEEREGELALECYVEDLSAKKGVL